MLEVTMAGRQLGFEKEQSLPQHRRIVLAGVFLISRSPWLPARWWHTRPLLSSELFARGERRLTPAPASLGPTALQDAASWAERVNQVWTSDCYFRWSILETFPQRCPFL